MGKRWAPTCWAVCATYAVGAGPDDQDRRLGRLDAPRRGLDALLIGDGAARVAAGQGRGVGLLVGDVFRELQVHGAQLLLLAQAKGLADARGNVVGRGELA